MLYKVILIITGSNTDKVQLLDIHKMNINQAKTSMILIMIMQLTSKRQVPFIVNFTYLQHANLFTKHIYADLPNVTYYIYERMSSIDYIAVHIKHCLSLPASSHVRYILHGDSPISFTISPQRGDDSS